MAKTKQNQGPRKGGPQVTDGFLSGLTSLVERLGELVDKGQEFRKSGTIGGLDPEGKLQGVYGFTLRTCLGEKGEEIKVEPFGNMRPDEQTGQPVVHEISEPMVDVFEEADQVLVVAELPGISNADLKLELRDDILVIAASRGKKNYHKEVLLPSAFTAEKMNSSCRNGVLEVRFQK